MATISKATSTLITGKTGSGRSEKQHECGDGVGHPISAHDELGRCHVDDCACPGYAAEKDAPVDRETDAPADSRDTVE